MSSETELTDILEEISDMGADGEATIEMVKGNQLTDAEFVIERMDGLIKRLGEQKDVLGLGCSAAIDERKLTALEEVEYLMRKLSNFCKDMKSGKFKTDDNVAGEDSQISESVKKELGSDDGSSDSTSSIEQNDQPVINEEDASMRKIYAKHHEHDKSDRFFQSIESVLEDDIRHLFKEITEANQSYFEAIELYNVLKSKEAKSSMEKLTMTILPFIKRLKEKLFIHKEKANYLRGLCDDKIALVDDLIMRINVMMSKCEDVFKNDGKNLEDELTGSKKMEKDEKEYQVVKGIDVLSGEIALIEEECDEILEVFEKLKPKDARFYIAHLNQHAKRLHVIKERLINKTSHLKKLNEKSEEEIDLLTNLIEHVMNLYEEFKKKGQDLESDSFMLVKNIEKSTTLDHNLSICSKSISEKDRPEVFGKNLIIRQTNENGGQSNVGDGTEYIDGDGTVYRFPLTPQPQIPFPFDFDECHKNITGMNAKFIIMKHELERMDLSEIRKLYSHYRDLFEYNKIEFEKRLQKAWGVIFTGEATCKTAVDLMSVMKMIFQNLENRLIEETERKDRLREQSALEGVQSGVAHLKRDEHDIGRIVKARSEELEKQEHLANLKNEIVEEKDIGDENSITLIEQNLTTEEEEERKAEAAKALVQMLEHVENGSAVAHSANSKQKKRKGKNQKEKKKSDAGGRDFQKPKQIKAVEKSDAKKTNGNVSAVETDLDEQEINATHVEALAGTEQKIDECERKVHEKDESGNTEVLATVSKKDVSEISETGKALAIVVSGLTDADDGDDLAAADAYGDMTLSTVETGDVLVTDENGAGKLNTDEDEEKYDEQRALVATRAEVFGAGDSSLIREELENSNNVEALTGAEQAIDEKKVNEKDESDNTEVLATVSNKNVLDIAETGNALANVVSDLTDTDGDDGLAAAEAYMTFATVETEDVLVTDENGVGKLNTDEEEYKHDEQRALIATRAEVCEVGDSSLIRDELDNSNNVEALTGVDQAIDEKKVKDKEKSEKAEDLATDENADVSPISETGNALTTVASDLTDADDGDDLAAADAYGDMTLSTVETGDVLVTDENGAGKLNTDEDEEKYDEQRALVATRAEVFGAGDSSLIREELENSNNVEALTGAEQAIDEKKVNEKDESDNTEVLATVSNKNVLDIAETGNALANVVSDLTDTDGDDGLAAAEAYMTFATVETEDVLVTDENGVGKLNTDEEEYKHDEQRALIATRAEVCEVGDSSLIRDELDNSNNVEALTGVDQAIDEKKVKDKEKSEKAEDLATDENADVSPISETGNALTTVASDLTDTDDGDDLVAADAYGDMTFSTVETGDVLVTGENGAGKFNTDEDEEKYDEQRALVATRAEVFGAGDSSLIRALSGVEQAIDEKKANDKEKSEKADDLAADENADVSPISETGNALTTVASDLTDTDDGDDLVAADAYGDMTFATVETGEVLVTDENGAGKLNTDEDEEKYDEQRALVATRAEVCEAGDSSLIRNEVVYDNSNNVEALSGVEQPIDEKKVNEKDESDNTEVLATVSNKNVLDIAETGNALANVVSDLTDTDGDDGLAAAEAYMTFATVETGEVLVTDENGVGKLNTDEEEYKHDEQRALVATRAEVCEAGDSSLIRNEVVYDNSNNVEALSGVEQPIDEKKVNDKEKSEKADDLAADENADVSPISETGNALTTVASDLTVTDDNDDLAAAEAYWDSHIAETENTAAETHHVLKRVDNYSTTADTAIVLAAEKTENEQEIDTSDEIGNDEKTNSGDEENITLSASQDMNIGTEESATDAEMVRTEEQDEKNQLTAEIDDAIKELKNEIAKNNFYLKRKYDEFMKEKLQLKSGKCSYSGQQFINDRPHEYTKHAASPVHLVLIRMYIRLSKIFDYGDEGNFAIEQISTHLKNKTDADEIDDLELGFALSFNSAFDSQMGISYKFLDMKRFL